MQLREGQVYEGRISISGDDGPFRRWIVVAPFGKTHIHALDEPLGLRCWPLTLVEIGLASGRLRYAGEAPDHPVLEVQRLKEALEVRDIHLGIAPRELARLLAALRDAADAGRACAPWLAGEILAAVGRTAALGHRREAIESEVHSALNAARGPRAEPVRERHPLAVPT